MRAELIEYLKNEAAQAKQDAGLYRKQAQQCAELRAGLDRSLALLRSEGAMDFRLEVYLLEQISAAVQSEAKCLKEVFSYESKAKECLEMAERAAK